MKLGTCQICDEEAMLGEVSTVAYNVQNDPPMQIKQTIQICNTCFMRWWNKEIQLKFDSVDILAAM